MHRYEPRPIEFHGIRTNSNWRLKLYTIAYGGAPLDWNAFSEGLALANNALPQPAISPERAGVGFVIAHQGNGANYVVLGWWDRENELPLRVFVSLPDDRGAWRAARGSESVCVWDLEVIWFEREAYVATLLDGTGTNAVAAYLARTSAAASAT